MADRPKRVRQIDIARAAGVSQTTVSLVLSGSADATIGAEARETVLATARELGYAPDPLAQKLASGRSSLLGIHTFAPTFPTNLNDSYYPYLEGVEVEAAEQGFDLVLFTGAHQEGEDTLRVQRLRLADGLVLVGRHPRMADVRAMLADGQTLVYIGRHDEFGPEIPYVGADYTPATAELVERLRALGHRHLLYLQDTDEAAASLDRERGFLQPPLEAGERRTAIRISPDRVIPERVAEWIRDGYTAFLVEGTDTHDLLANTISAIHANGLDFPRDVSVAITGGYELEYGGRSFTGFAVPRREMGREAARLLIRRILSEPVAPEEVHRLLPCTPVEGATVRAVG